MFYKFLKTMFYLHIIQGVIFNMSLNQISVKCHKIEDHLWPESESWNFDIKLLKFNIKFC